jgi:serine/threonine protein kinase
MSAPEKGAVVEKPEGSVQLDRLTFDVLGIKEGGFGRVWFLRRPAGASFEVVYGEKCVVKTFKADEDDQQALIEQELGNWVSLRSPHIARLVKICRLNFELGALMEMMPGSLADYLQRHGNLTETQAKTVLLDVLEGLDYAYREQRLVHLDLKPDNLLLMSANDPHVQITDWGISRIATQSGAQFSGGTPVHQSNHKTQFNIGTTPYMAPERFSRSWSIGKAADVFSLGIIAVELLTGQLPSYDGDPFRSQLLITSHEYFRRAKYLLRNIGNGLRSIVLNMLDPEPDRRLNDYRKIIAFLEKA